MSKETLSKGVTEAQYAAFEEACRKVGLSLSDGKEAAFKRFCEAAGIVWPNGFTRGGDRKSMKTYIIELDTVRGWKREQLAPPGSGRIELAADAITTVKLDNGDGNFLEVCLSRPAEIPASAQHAAYYVRVEGAMIISPRGEIVRYLDPKQIQLK